MTTQRSKILYTHKGIQCNINKNTTSISIAGSSKNFKKFNDDPIEIDIQQMNKSEYPDESINIYFIDMNCNNDIYINISESVSSSLRFHFNGIISSGSLHIISNSSNKNVHIDILSSHIISLYIDMDSNHIESLKIINSYILNGGFENDTHILHFYQCNSFIGLNLSNTNILNVNESDSKFLDNFEFTNKGMIVYKQFGLHYRTPNNWVIEENSIIRSYTNYNRDRDCSFGINVATKAWIRMSGASGLIVWKCLIPNKYLPFVVVPSDISMTMTNNNERVKIRTPYLKLLQQYNFNQFFQI